jgi:hypothetical protein
MLPRPNDKLTKPLTRALKALSLHERRFQPLQLRGSVATEVADQLVVLGLAERGDSDARFEDWGYATGYRLTRAGWTALNARRRG